MKNIEYDKCYRRYTGVNSINGCEQWVIVKNYIIFVMGELEELDLMLFCMYIILHDYMDIMNINHL